MPDYEYEALDSSGKLVTGTSSHPNEAFARAKLEKLGLHPVKLSVRDQQQQVAIDDDLEPETPPTKWATFYGYFVVWFFLVGVVSLTGAVTYARFTMGPNNSWFPYSYSKYAWGAAILYTSLLLVLSTSDQRFWSYFFRIVLVAPIMMAIAYAGNYLVVLTGGVWLLLMLLYTIITKRGEFPDLGFGHRHHSASSRPTGRWVYGSTCGSVCGGGCGGGGCGGGCGGGD